MHAKVERWTMSYQLNPGGIANGSFKYGRSYLAHGILILDRT